MNMSLSMMCVAFTILCKHVQRAHACDQHFALSRKVWRKQRQHFSKCQALVQHGLSLVFCFGASRVVRWQGRPSCVMVCLCVSKQHCSAPMALLAAELVSGPLERGRPPSAQNGFLSMRLFSGTIYWKIASRGRDF